MYQLKAYYCFPVYLVHNKGRGKTVLRLLHTFFYNRSLQRGLQQVCPLPCLIAYRLSCLTKQFGSRSFIAEIIRFTTLLTAFASEVSICLLD